MLKDVWGSLMDMRTDVSDVKSQLEAGFSEMRVGFKNVRILRARVSCAYVYLLSLSAPHHPPPPRVLEQQTPTRVFVSNPAIRSAPSRDNPFSRFV